MKLFRGKHNSLWILTAIILMLGAASLYFTSKRMMLDDSLFEKGDQILSINGIGIQSGDELDFLIGQHTSANSVTIKIARETLQTVYSITLTEKNENEIKRTTYRSTLNREFQVSLIERYSKLQLIGILISSLCFIFLAIFVLFKKPDDLAVKYFSATTIGAGFIILHGSGSFEANFFSTQNWIHLISLASYHFTPTFLIYFTFLFPEQKWKWRHALFIFTGLISLILLVMTGTGFFNAITHQSIEDIRSYVKWMNFSRIFFAIGMLFGFANFVHSYLHTENESDRKRLRWVLFGMIFGTISFVVLSIVPKLLFHKPILNDEFMIAVVTLTPISFAIAIVKYRLMNIDLIFNRSFVYTIVIAMLAGVYAIVVTSASEFVGRIEIDSPYLTSAIATLIVLLLFEPIKLRVQKLVDKKLFKVQYNFRESERKFIEALRDQFSEVEVSNLLVEQVETMFSPKWVGVLLMTHPQVKMHSNSTVDFSPEKLSEMKIDLLQTTSNHSRPCARMSIVESGAEIDSGNDAVLIKWNLAAAFPLISENNSLLGVLCIAEKNSNLIYSAEDFDFLNSLSTQAGLAISRIQLQKELLLKDEEAKRLKELSDLKSHFVASVSHDLRTPLTSIRMFAEMLESQEGLNNEQAKSYLNIIQGESDRLTKLITNVLSFAKEENAKATYQFSEYDLNELILSTIQSLRYQLDMQQFKVDLQLHSEPILIIADREMLSQAIENLITNSMKYSDRVKEIQISTSIHNGSAKMTIADKGIGIAAEHLPKIYEPFYRADDERVRRLGGTGLGLSLVKSIVEAHHGVIEIQSTLNQGTTGALFLPQPAHKQS